MAAALSIRLDSSHPQAKRSWTCSPFHPALLLRCDGATRQTALHSAGGVERCWADPLEALSWMEQSLRESANSGARWIGYLSYDLGRLFEVLPATGEDDTRLPLFAFALYDPGTMAEPVLWPETPRVEASGLRSNFPRRAYLEAVERAIRYIEAGDIFQVNLSQRFTAPLVQPPVAVYQRLLRDAPAWFGGYLDFGDHALLCNSPELFLDVRPDPVTGLRRVRTRPIKGTRPRKAGMEEELRASIKDQAELNMIVDLERNDLGRVCRIGSVKVVEPRAIEAHPTVYHGAATVEGVLREEVTFVDLLRATFPGGSITGAPKIRAMQIIEELESVRRGPYCGAIGFLGGDGHWQFNIAIRTIIARAGCAHVCVGGGIVADSRPVEEYDETLVKAAAMFAALGLDGELQKA